jgi:hypothetical protein
MLVLIHPGPPASGEALPHGGILGRGLVESLVRRRDCGRAGRAARGNGTAGRVGRRPQLVVGLGARRLGPSRCRAKFGRRRGGG